MDVLTYTPSPTRSESLSESEEEELRLCVALNAKRIFSTLLGDSVTVDASTVERISSNDARRSLSETVELAVSLNADQASELAGDESSSAAEAVESAISSEASSEDSALHGAQSTATPVGECGNGACEVGESNEGCPDDCLFETCVGNGSCPGEKRLAARWEGLAH